jgi:hypothetical protein
MLKTYQVQLKSNQGAPNHQPGGAITALPLSLPRISTGILLAEGGDVFINRPAPPIRGFDWLSRETNHLARVGRDLERVSNYICIEGSGCHFISPAVIADCNYYRDMCVFGINKIS